MVDAALNGSLASVEYEYDAFFHLNVPKSCPGVPAEILKPKNTWVDKQAYDTKAKMLAKKFSDAFDKAYGDKNIKQSVVKMCPGK